MKKLVFVLTLFLMGIYSCNKLPQAFQNANNDVYLSKEDPEPAVDATYYDHGPDDFGCDGAPTNCVVLDPIVLGKSSITTEDLIQFLGEKYQNEYHNGNLTLEKKYNKITQETFYIFKNQKGDLVRVIDIPEKK